MPWTARRSNQSILKEISPEYSLEGLVLKLKNILATQSKKTTHWKRPWCWETLKARGERDDREWDGWMALPIQWTWIGVNSTSWWWTGRPGVVQSMGVTKSQTRLSDWTELNQLNYFLQFRITAGDFLGSSLVKTPVFQCRRHGCDPCSGSKILYAMCMARRKQINKNKKNKRSLRITASLWCQNLVSMCSNAE